MFYEAFIAMWLICSLIMLGKTLSGWKRHELPYEALVLVVVAIVLGPVGLGIALDRQAARFEEKSNA